jgi:ferredoxin
MKLKVKNKYMILYFSATGNTKLIAEKIAEQLGDTCLDLLERIKTDDWSYIRSDRPFVICSPVYVSELPVFFAEYLKKVSLTGCNEVYGILTNGGYSGIAGGQMKNIVRQKGMIFKGYAEFKLASNHITYRSHKELSEAETRERTQLSLAKVKETADVIRNGGVFRNRYIFALEYLITVPTAPLFMYCNQGTKDFWTKDTCISCGKCVRLCPLNAIRMENGRPQWILERCAHCMSCIANCPTEAIEYADVTQGKERYRMSKVRL